MLQNVCGDVQCLRRKKQKIQKIKSNTWMQTEEDCCNVSITTLIHEGGLPQMYTQIIITAQFEISLTCSHLTKFNTHRHTPANIYPSIQICTQRKHHSGTKLLIINHGKCLLWQWKQLHTQTSHLVFVGWTSWGFLWAEKYPGFLSNFKARQDTNWLNSKSDCQCWPCYSPVNQNIAISKHR